MQIGNALSPSKWPALLLDMGSVRYDLSNETYNFNTKKMFNLVKLLLNYCFGSQLCFAPVAATYWNESDTKRRGTWF